MLPPKELTTGLSLITFSQFFGGTLFIAFAQAVFINELPITLHQYAPALGNGPNTGNSAIQTTAIPAAILPGVLMAYNKAIIYTFVSLLCEKLHTTGGSAADMADTVSGHGWSGMCIPLKLGNGIP